MEPQPDLLRILATIGGIGIGLLVLYLCHKIVSGTHEAKASKVMLGLESVAAMSLFVTYFHGEVMHTSDKVTGQQPSEHFGVTAADYIVIFGTLATSMVLYFAFLWGLKKLGRDDD